ncbi:hypothetical protein [Pediococcus pentosaceus]|uniref:hypothetical protein n=1 Tax=Pediococcus pentosaceus TaxID=1255 RepID=UPI0020BF9ED4|nr:hypothetical protein [Pediococcus pentosaceus]
MKLNLMKKNKFESLSKNDREIYFYGAISKTIFSFEGNKKIPTFLKSTFDITFRDYVFRAKPLVVSRTIKIFTKMENLDIVKEYDKLLVYTEENMKNEKKEGETSLTNKDKKTNSKNANSSLEKWLKGM